MSTATTKIELLHEASRMLLARGLNGFSLQELATSLNIKKASLYHHYPSKNALAIELYRFYQESFCSWVKKYEHLTPEKQVINYAHKLTDWIVKKQRICPVGALSLEWQLVDQNLKVEITKLHELHRDWLTQLFKKIPTKIPRKDAVSSVMALIQGSIQIARMDDDPDLVVKNLKTYLKSIKL